MIKNRASQLESRASESHRGAAQMLAISRRGIRANADFRNLLREHAQAHRLAAAASTLPRVRAHLTALADQLEAMLGGDQDDPQVANGATDDRSTLSA
jgi:hypothetical protein